MEVSLKEDVLGAEIGSSVESVQKLLVSQSKLFHSQIDQLQNIVVTQCKLTGANPLSQEMAAGALSIKIGKRPRDLLNPKAVKYMQSVFSIKDAISKKESREISALFGVTVTQVREFFASQRSKVRKIVRLSREKAIKSNACNVQQDGVPTDSDPMIPIDQAPLNSVGPSSAETQSCSTQDEALQGTDDSDKHFIENILSMMRKEETFAGQVKLMEWILKIQNPSVLEWFLTKGGVMILATWLSEAAIEEQTSLMLVILKVLCHLPLHEALPVHLSAILQSVNRLRFYKASDISNRARVLLAKWSKMFARSQALKRPNGKTSSCNGQKEIMLKRSFDEIISDESWQSNLGIPMSSFQNEEVLAISHGSSENFRKLESPQTLKLLPAPGDETNRKNILGVSSSQNRERRKVQLVEQPQQKSGGRSPLATRPVKTSQGRPMSADDIQKAKMRAQFMQSKYRKISSSSNDNQKGKIENSINPSTTQSNTVPLVSKVSIQPKTEEQKKCVSLPSKVINPVMTPPSLKVILEPSESLWEKCKRVQIPWQTPPEMGLHDLWRVGDGENSKEVGVQKNRNHREKETFYLTAMEIPSNPKEPWDVEMDYDDSLTTEIPTEQLPDADVAETQVVQDQAQQVVPDEASVSPTSVTASSSIAGNASFTAPDLELLAVLLKNPELVFALTSGQASNLSGEDTVRLLDMIKAGLPGSVNGLGGNVEEKVEVSLPSPTPSSNPQTSAWKPEVSRNPFSRQTSYGSAGVAVTIPALEKQPAATYLMQPPVQTPSATLHHHQPIVSPLRVMPEKQPLSSYPFPQPSASDRYGNPLPSSNVNLPHYENLDIGRTSKPEKPSPYHIPEFSQTQPHHRLSRIPDSHSYTAPSYPSRPSAGNPGTDSDYWRSRQGQAQNPPFQADQDGYSTFTAGQMQRNEYGTGHGHPGFESWSPENSPRRPQTSSGRNPPDQRTRYDQIYRNNRTRDRNSSEYHDSNNGRYRNRRWNDHESDRRH